jgi:hypothetical protein
MPMLNIFPRVANQEKESPSWFGFGMNFLKNLSP